MGHMSEQQTQTPQLTIPSWTIADRLRKAREHAGLTQTGLADETGISRQTVSNYETGATSPSRVYLAAWALRCGVPVEWLRDGTAPNGGDDGPSGLQGSDSRRKGNSLELAAVVSLRSALPLAS